MYTVGKLLLNLSGDQDFPCDCFGFQGVWNIIDMGGGQNKK